MSGILIFEIVVILLTLGVFTMMKKKGYPNVLRKFIILFVAAFLFEILTEPFWTYPLFQAWTFIGGDISWFIPLGWSGIIMAILLIVDKSFPKIPERRRFWIYLCLLEVIISIIEGFLINTGIKSYNPILSDTFYGYMIPLTNVPLEILFAVPLMVVLIIPFYKYLNYLFNKNG